MFDQIMQKLRRWITTLQERLRGDDISERRSESAHTNDVNTLDAAQVNSPKEVIKEKPYTPRTLEEFIGVVARTPRNVLDETDRARLAAVMSFNDRRVADLMRPKSEIVFVKSTEILGPLVLDRLYKSGFTNFPVVDSHEHIKGIIHTEALNSLAIKKAERADKYMDKGVSYLHQSDTLAQAVSEIERTNSYYFLVLDENNNLTGFFTTEMLLSYLLGK
jgi:CBS domain containing-hemolysin-like protein